MEISRKIGLQNLSKIVLTYWQAELVHATEICGVGCQVIPYELEAVMLKYLCLTRCYLFKVQA